MSKNLYLEIVNNSQADWTCMCCAHSMHHNPPLSRDAWKQVQFSKAALSQNKKSSLASSSKTSPPPSPSPSPQPAATLIDSDHTKKDTSEVDGDKGSSKVGCG